MILTEVLAAAVQAGTAFYLGLDQRAPSDIVTFPVQQTACPAMIVELPSIGVIDEELRLGEPWYQRKQAYGIFLGILHHYGVDDSASIAVSFTDSIPSNWLVTLDRTWSLLTDADGRAVFPMLPAGDYPVWLRRGSVSMPWETLRIEPGEHRIDVLSAR